MSGSDSLQKIVVLCVVAIVAGVGIYLYVNNDEAKTPDTVINRVEDQQNGDSSPPGGEEPVDGRENNENPPAGDPPAGGEPNDDVWTTYTSPEWKYAFSYPDDYELTNMLDGNRIIVSPPGEFSERTPWFEVKILQHPDVAEVNMVPEELFHLANYGNGKLAWLRDKGTFDYEGEYLIDLQEENNFGKNNDVFALRVRELNTDADVEEDRTIVYVPRHPAVYMITWDLLAGEELTGVFEEIEDSFEWLD